MTLWLLFVVPLAASIVAIVAPPQLAGIVTIAVGIMTFVLALVLIPAVVAGPVAAGPAFRVDALSEVFLLATTLLYALLPVYCVGYFADERRSRSAVSRRYLRRFLVGFNLFAWSMICAPLVNGLALLWVAVEITTVVSALLVAIDATDGATEAAWKYVLIASSGLGIALLGTIVLYYAGAQVLGPTFDLEFAPLIRAASRLPAVPVELAFGLAVIGFGTKVGWVPMHTWLPDAHAEAPTPISALLSGSLLATSFYAVLRFYQVAVPAAGPVFPRTMLLVFGGLSLLLAALYLFGQRNIKRLLAYSSVEHMGILAIGIGFGSPVAAVGVMLHVLAHAAGKGTAFMGAGVIVHKMGSKQVAAIRGGLDLLPASGPIFLAAIFALAALPPFGLFRSEFMIVLGGAAAGQVVLVMVFVVLVAAAFAGLTWTSTRMLLIPAPAGAVRGEPSWWMVAPALIGLIALLVLGIHPPDLLTTLLTQAAAAVQGPGR